MRNLLIFISIFYISITAASAQNAYRLNQGDELRISVWKEDGLKEDVLILPDGTFSFPLAGQIKAAGKTVMAVRKVMTKQIRKFVPGAMVTVSVLRPMGNKIFVMGEVNKPGEYQPRRRLDVVQALSLAGGLTAYASQDRIIILRHNGKKKISMPFPYSDIVKGKRLDRNIELKSGDTVVVPGRTLF